MEVEPFSVYSLVGKDDLRHLIDCVKDLISRGIEGDLLEAGVWKGGCCMVMRATLDEANDTRLVILADSFKGCPEPKWPQDKGDEHYKNKGLSITEEEVHENFKRIGLYHHLWFLSGWFKDSLKSEQIGKLALIRLDGDLYESTYESLENLYPKLSEGGYCIIDDYHPDNHPACKKAVDDYREKYGITQKIERASPTNRFSEVHFWIK